MTAFKLYELPAFFRFLDDAIDDAGGEITPEIQEQIDALESNLEDKADAICALVRSAEAEDVAVQAEIDRLMARRNAARSRSHNLKRYMLACLEQIGRDRVDGPRFKVRVQRNSTPSIEWTGEPDAIPDGFRRVVVEVDGKAAREAFKAGTLPVGFSASVGRHLRIS
jgi:hypothetical protein